MRQESDYTVDQAILAVWQDELKATRDATIKQQCLRQERDLLPRFATHYQELKTLRRRVRRSLQRQWKRSLAGLALLMTLGQMPALAATIKVTQSCTLVKAIVAADNDTTSGGSCVRGSGADTIVLPANSKQTLTTVDTDYNGPTGLPPIRSVIIITGNNSTIRRASTAPEFRIFAVGGSGNLVLQRTTVSGGLISTNYGAGVRSDGVLTLINSTISNNSAEGFNFGGGVYDGPSGGPISVTNSTITGNSAYLGGGIASNGGAITNSTISDNVAQGTSGRGGGLNNRGSGTFTVTNSTISGNTSNGNGAVVNYTYGRLFLTNTTISGNTASRGSGGLTNYGNLYLDRTLISGNNAISGFAPEVVSRETQARVFAYNFNLFGHDGNAGISGFSPGATDIVPTQPLSAILDTTLANNGGPTQTHALVTGSPAVDAVTNGTCPPPNTDQRGITRPQDGNGEGGAACDIGSFELSATQPESCAGLTATIIGTPGDESIPGTDGPDVIAGLGGADQISGLGGNDVLCGGTGNDTILSGLNNDRAFGEIGNDLVRGGGGADQVNGAAGTDQLFGDEANDQLTGGTGTDRCDGGSGTDTSATCETRISIP